MSPPRAAAGISSRSCQGSRGLSTTSSRSTDALRLRRLAGELLGLVEPERTDVPVGFVVHRAPHLGLALLCPLALPLGALREIAALAVVLLERLPRVPAGAFSLIEVRLPTTTEHRDAMCELVDLGDVGHDPIEKSAVVADEQHRGGQRDDPLLEMIEPVEIEVVGRLVEQVHVEPGQQQGGQPRPRRLTARQRGGGLAEQSVVDAEPVVHLTDPCVEIGGTQRQPPLQRAVVSISGGRRLVDQGGHRGIELHLGLSDAGATEQQFAHGLRRAMGLLAQPTDGRGGRRQAHLATVGRELTGRDREQGGLADAVGADHADPIAGRDDQIDRVEDRTGPATDGDVVQGQGCGHERCLRAVERCGTHHVRMCPSCQKRRSGRPGNQVVAVRPSRPSASVST